jgi:sec-independent protein translocase protein TatA
MFGIGPTELVLIALAVGILFFGSGKIIDLARSLGRVSGEFKKGKAEVEKELRASEDSAMKEDDTRA